MDPWNWVDFIIVFAALWPQFLGSQTSRRMTNRNPGMKLVVNSLCASIPQILNVLALLLLTIFNILVVNNFKGKLYSCNNSRRAARAHHAPRMWSNLTTTEQAWFDPLVAQAYAAFSQQHTLGRSSETLTSHMFCGFDNVLSGRLTFFEISTTEDWVTLMLASVDATEIDMHPIANYRESWTLFSIAFIFFGSSFIIQLFIGVVIENFNKMKEKLDGTYLLSGSQREWLMISTAIFNLGPMYERKTPRSRLRKLYFRVTQSPTLETITMGCILLNTFIMALTYFGQENLYCGVINYLSYFFGIVFTIEAAIKIIGLGRYYWKESWNIFDFSVALGSLIGNLVRVARLIKLIQTAPSLRQLVNTLLITLPSLVSIDGLLSLIFFIYAALGVQLFAKVKMGDLVTPTTNFQSIGIAMSTLICSATGER
uniref:Ion transport domain-containing protein n=1 Tax=Globisporangium ultimum (strain ATCC 200006 / CBS 805.95 / DAOM BR144) TaxID=431595 RepID=K3WPZ8_GLOUD